MAYDKRGKEVKDNNISLSSKKVTVSVNILKQKEIPITLDTPGEPEDGYEIENIKLSRDNLMVSGEEDAIDQISGIDISDEIDMEKHNGNFVEEIDLKQFLPEGIAVQGDTVIRVNVTIAKLATKTIHMENSEIRVKNLKNGLNYNISGKTVDFLVRGKKENLKDISEKDFQVSVNLEGYNAGENITVPPEIKAPEGIEILKKDDVKIKISK